MSQKLVRPRILIVEDEEDSRSILRWLLEQEGYEIVEAGDGQSAVEKALSARPDLILMDISLPRMDGLQAASEIRAALPDSSLVIIAMSAYDKHEARDQAIHAGCNDYAPKPLDLERLEAIIKRYLK
jgi:CheY-like chemotaxis protein